MSDKEEQLLHLVFGGELEDLKKMKFKDLDDLDIVGIFPNYSSAFMWIGAHWKPSNAPAEC